MPTIPETDPARAPIGQYRDANGRRRELCTLNAGAGSTLVIDRDAEVASDALLLAHLSSDEPPENAILVCRRYLEHVDRPRCRALRAEDRRLHPPARGRGRVARRDTAIHDRDGTTYRLRLLAGEHTTAELRWCARAAGDSAWRRVSLRHVVGRCESYEPARTLTEDALGGGCRGGDAAHRRLRWELERMLESPIVLNRGLREAVVRTMRERGLSMSAVALRCGAVKRNRHGRLSGETSWLARRIGTMPESGSERPTPWVHSDVLAAIARDGLGLSPREVEVG